MTDETAIVDEGIAVAEPLRPEVLTFQDATLIPNDRAMHSLRNVHLTLREGDVVMVRLEMGRESLPLADAAVGLLTPTEGDVRIRGSRWSEMPPRKLAAQRGRIGRVFHGEAWVSNLNLLDNVVLSRQHHTTLPSTRVMSEALEWANRFGMSDIPRDRPSLVPAGTRRLSEWVRAFSSEPELLLLENPTRGVPHGATPRLLTAVTDAAARGAAVLLLTNDDEVWSARSFAHLTRLVAHEERLEPVEATP